MICGEELDTQVQGHILVNPCVRKFAVQSFFSSGKVLLTGKCCLFMCMCPIDYIVYSRVLMSLLKHAWA